MKYTINGATGWLGQATLGAIKSIDPWIQLQELQFLSSSRKGIEAAEFGFANSKSLSDDLDTLEVTEFFVQLAFKTRDYVAKIGAESYEIINSQIIHNSLIAIKKTKPSHLVMVSSGAVSQWLSNPVKHKFDPYIKMKLQEEKEIMILCKQLGINVVNLRLWGASGRHMTEPLKYAIGDLIFQDQVGDYLKIQSNHPVYRRYADASQQMEVCLRHASNDGNLTLESGGVILEIEELAEKIIESSGSKKSIERKKVNNEVEDRYFSTSQKMEELAEALKIQLVGIEKQIPLTSQAVSQYLLKTSTRLN